MPAVLSLVNILMPRVPRDLSHERNSRQHSADSVDLSTAPMTARQPSSLTPMATIMATFPWEHLQLLFKWISPT
ncbi:hypothetical protein B5F84_02335 [Olsenella sp. An290]|nr:hypothetical protein B5F84_02335 [Olsenella sp. An290]